MSPISKKQRRAIESDKQQALLASEMPSGVVLPEDDTPKVEDFVATKVMCPFCLHVDYVNRFYIKIKKGTSQKRARCPDCNTLMQMQSLTADMTVEQYAEWVYNYSTSGFWKKVNFNEFNQRLRKLGMSYRFWTRYKALKAEHHEETPDEAYERYMEDNRLDT